MYYTRRMVDGQTTAGTPAGDVGHDHGAADVLVKELAGDEAIKAADTLLLTIPNQLGVDYNAHVLESILKYVAPELGWR